MSGVLRYRLFDIDRLISRTLSYAIVTTILTGVYALVILGPLSLFGTGRRPQWLVAVATLCAAALFNPVRRRINSSVDHRFDRRRYDAVSTIDAFGFRMRAVVDMDELGAELTSVVATTMQPSCVALWLSARAQPVEIQAHLRRRNPRSVRRTRRCFSRRA